MSYVCATILLMLLQHTSIAISNKRIKVKTPVVGPDGFCRLANKCNLQCTRYNIRSEDGYILGLYNIPGDRRKPLYLQHGFVDSSDTFLIRGNLSLVAFLAKKGYDVWLGNTRGNVHSRAHLWLSPKDLHFWEFSFHEIGIYDVPAIIDFILKKTGENQLEAIAHSEGSTSFFIMGAMRPEYNKKVKLLICLGPVAYLHNAESPMLSLISLKGVTSKSRTVNGYGEFLRNSASLVSVIRIACTQKLVFYSICVNSMVVNIFEREYRRPEPEFWPISLRHYPSGSSLRSGVHLLQIASRRKFAQYDYGISGNKLKYSTVEPPDYKLSKVSMKIALFIGLSDKVSDLKDVELLRRQLPKVVDYHIMSVKQWRHLDFVWGKDSHLYLFDYIDNLLNKYFYKG